MVKKRTSIYANMTSSDLARVTRERGLTKPEGMVNISEWADWLEALDVKAAQAPQSVGEPVSDEDAANMEEADHAALPDYANMTKAEVLELAESRGMVTKTNTSKTEAVDWLVAADGITEDEQAAMDETPTEN